MSVAILNMSGIQIFCSTTRPIGLPLKPSTIRRANISRRARPQVTQHDAPIACTSGKSPSKSSPDSGAAPLMLLPALLAAPAAFAQDEPSPGFFGLTFSPLEISLLLSPIVFYGIFNVYRDQINPKASWSDFVFIIAAILVLGNILSIIFLKIRLF